MRCSLVSWYDVELQFFFILRQLQEKHTARKKDLFLTFVGLEKGIGRVPLDTAWWVFKKLVVKEWEVKIVQSIVCTPIPFLLGI